MDANMMKKLQELLESEAFGKEIENVQSAEELQSAFAAHGVDMTVEEVEEVCAAIVAKNEGTLDENALEQVSGGIAFLTAAAVCVGACAVSYVAGYVGGRIIRKKSGYCG